MCAFRQVYQAPDLTSANKTSKSSSCNSPPPSPTIHSSHPPIKSPNPLSSLPTNQNAARLHATHLTNGHAEEDSNWIHINSSDVIESNGLNDLNEPLSEDQWFEMHRGTAAFVQKIKETFQANNKDKESNTKPKLTLDLQRSNGPTTNISTSFNRNHTSNPSNTTKNHDHISKSTNINNNNNNKYLSKTHKSEYNDSNLDVANAAKNSEATRILKAANSTQDQNKFHAGNTPYYQKKSEAARPFQDKNNREEAHARKDSQKETINGGTAAGKSTLVRKVSSFNNQPDSKPKFATQSSLGSEAREAEFLRIRLKSVKEAQYAAEITIRETQKRNELAGPTTNHADANIATDEDGYPLVSVIERSNLFGVPLHAKKNGGDQTRRKNATQPQQQSNVVVAKREPKKTNNISRQEPVIDRSASNFAHRVDGKHNDFVFVKSTEISERSDIQTTQVDKTIPQNTNPSRSNEDRNQENPVISSQDAAVFKMQISRQDKDSAKTTTPNDDSNSVLEFQKIKLKKVDENISPIARDLKLSLTCEDPHENKSIELNSNATKQKDAVGDFSDQSHQKNDSNNRNNSNNKDELDTIFKDSIPLDVDPTSKWKNEFAVSKFTDSKSKDSSTEASAQRRISSRVIDLKSPASNIENRWGTYEVVKNEPENRENGGQKMSSNPQGETGKSTKIKISNGEIKIVNDHDQSSATNDKTCLNNCKVENIYETINVSEMNNNHIQKDDGQEKFADMMTASVDFLDDPFSDDNKKSDEKLKNVIKEIVTSERKYLSRLKLLDEDFCSELQFRNKSQNIIPEEKIKQIFINIESLKNFHSHFLVDLESCLESKEEGVVEQPTKEIGSVFKHFSPYMKLYSVFLQEFISANDTIMKCIQKYPKFEKFLIEIQSKPECNNLSLQNHMLECVQRIPKYKLLLQKYIRCLPPDSKDKTVAEEALTEILASAQSSNELIKKSEVTLKLKEMSKNFKEKIFANDDKHAIFLKEGKVSILNKKPVGQLEERYLILFNEFLFICRAVNNKDQFKMINRLPIPEIQVRENIEFLQLTVSWQQKNFHIILEDETDFKSWKEAFTLTKEKINNKRIESNKIYYLESHVEFRDGKNGTWEKYNLSVDLKRNLYKYKDVDEDEFSHVDIPVNVNGYELYVPSTDDAQFKNVLILQTKHKKKAIHLRFADDQDYEKWLKYFASTLNHPSSLQHQNSEKLILNNSIDIEDLQV